MAWRTHEQSPGVLTSISRIPSKSQIADIEPRACHF